MVQTGIKLDLDVSDLVSNAGRARGAIAALTGEMKKAAKEERWGDFAKLDYQKRRLEGQNFFTERNLETLKYNPRFHATADSGSNILKMDADYANAIKDLNGNLKKLYAKYDEALKAGDTKTAQEIFPQITEASGKINKTMEEANAPPMGTTVMGALKALGINQIAGAISDGFSKYVSSLDRSGIISQYGAGDILGAQLAEKNRVANLQGGMTETIGGTVGTGLMLSGNPYAMAAGGLVTLASKLASALLREGPIEAGNEISHAKLWERRSADAMQLAALSGDPKLIWNAFNSAAEAAAKFGYSAEEGMDAIMKAAYQGLGPEKAREATERIFEHERSTGADRGTLTSISTLSERYGLGDNALQSGWAGLHASKMEKGQYGEFLQAMLRVMEDGVSKGFRRTADDVATNMAMIAQLGGNDPLWKGENGAWRLSEMSSGIESSTGLQSASDILIQRAARQILGDDASYVDVMKLVEEGLSGEHGAELFNNAMKLAFQAEGEGREGTVERIRQFFGQNYTNADTIFKTWLSAFNANGIGIDAVQLKETMADAKTQNPLSDASSIELETAQMNAQTVNLYTQAGQVKFDEQKKIYQAGLDTAKREFNKATGGNLPLSGVPKIDTAGLSAHDAEKAWESELREAGCSGNTDRMVRAFNELEKATFQRVDETKDQEKLHKRLGPAMDGLSSPGWQPSILKSDEQKGDHEAKEWWRDTIGKGIYSDDPEQRRQAADIVGIFEAMPMADRKAWDENNTLNAMFDSFKNSDSGDDDKLGRLLSAVERLTEETRKNREAIRELADVSVTIEAAP